MELTRQTAELRDVIAAGVDLWDFEYPSYYKDQAKKDFEQKVIDHFYFRQIGAETVGRFLHYFRRTVREIMPLYIQRYESVDLMKDPEIRPLDNYNMIEEYTASKSESSSSTGTSSSQHSATGSSTKSGKDASVNAEQDTPQGELAWSPSTDLDAVSVGYASRVTQDTSSTTGTETSTAEQQSDDTTEGSASSTGEDSHKLTRRGNIGVTTYAQLLEGYRETFLNIDMEIIRDLEICFLGVY